MLYISYRADVFRWNTNFSDTFYYFHFISEVFQQGKHVSRVDIKLLSVYEQGRLRWLQVEFVSKPLKSEKKTS